MVTVHIPAAMRILTLGEAQVSAEGSTLREVIEHLEAHFPGLQSRLAEEERLRSGLAAFVNGVSVRPLLSTRIPEGAEIFFAPAIAGGSSP